MPENINFEDRRPISPLSLENIEDSRPKEFIFDYTNNIAYVKLADGTLFNITESETSVQFVKQYLDKNPDLILDVTIKSDLDEDKTIQESINYIYNLIQEIRKKEFKYAGSPSDGGPANRADKVNHSIDFKQSDASIVSFDGEESQKVNLTTAGLFKKSGGYINGPMIPKKKFLLSENITYGLTLPKTGVEGQIFILLKEDV
jgi:hypothetical protein